MLIRRILKWGCNKISHILKGLNSLEVIVTAAFSTSRQNLVQLKLVFNMPCGCELSSCVASLSNNTQLNDLIACLKLHFSLTKCYTSIKNRPVISVACCMFPFWFVRISILGDFCPQK